MMPKEDGKLSPILAKPWLMLFLPVNAALAGFTVILPVLILFTYHADIIAVSLAMTLYSLLLIPGAIIWGHICDSTGSRVSLLLFNYLGITAIFLSMTFVRGLNELLIFYAIFGLIAPAGAAPSNLLIMERFSPSDRPAAYASFSEVSMVGSVVGILVGLLWVTTYSDNLLGFLYLTSIMAVISAGMLLVMLPEGKERFTRTTIVHQPESLISRLHIRYPFFLHPHVPSKGGMERFRKWLREEATHEVPLILAAGFLFNFSTNMFNTSYVPYLEVMGLGASGIFIVNLANNGCQMFCLPITARASEGAGAERTVVVATWGRVAGYMGVMVMSLFPLATIWSHGEILGSNLAMYGLLGVAVAFYGTASSLLLFRSLEGRSKGTYIGFNSALGGLAAVVGSAFSGLVTYKLGYTPTFAVSMILMACAVPIWVMAGRAMRRKHL
jgi:MFS family permease